MEHTYIEQFRKLWGSFNKDNEHLITEKIEDFILKVRTETLMECRGLVKDEELLADDKWEGTDEQRKHDMIAIIKNNERESFRTAIDNLIKKETV